MPVQNDPGLYQQNYSYNDGESEDSYIKRNMFSADNSYGASGFINPVSGIISGVRGRNAYKNARANYENRQRAQLSQRRLGQYTEDQNQAGRWQQADDDQRNAGLSALDSSYADPYREKARQAAYDTSYNSDFANLAQNYKQQSQSASLNAARRGRLGSSYDAEVQGGLANNFQNGAMTAENNASDYYSQLQDADTSQYENLRRALLVGDPQQAQAYENAAGNIGNDISRMYGRQAQNDQAVALNRQGMANTSALVGGAGNAAASGVYDYYGIQAGAGDDRRYSKYGGY